MRISGICLSLALVVGASSGRCGVVTLTSSRDTTIYENNGTRSNGGGSAMFAGTNSAGSPRRALIAFDLVGQIPDGAIVQSATLTLYVSGFGGTGGGGGEDPTTYLTSLHRMTHAWGEGTAGAGTGASGSGQGFATPNDGTSATWTHAFYNTESWGSAGGDFAASASATQLVSGTIGAGFTWGSNAAMVGDVQGWLVDPDSNFGWILLGDESTTQTFRNFYTREAEDLRPTLVVEYSVVPEASALLLAAVGAVAATARFRRRALAS